MNARQSSQSKWMERIGKRRKSRNYGNQLTQKSIFHFQSQARLAPLWLPPLRLWSMGLCLLIYELVCCSWSNTPNSKGKKESRLSHTHTLRDRQRAATQKRGRDYKRKINKNKSNSSNMLLTDSPYWLLLLPLPLACRKKSIPENRKTNRNNAQKADERTSDSLEPSK